MITEESPKFFRVLSGANAPLYEKILVTLYNEIYRGTMGQTVINRSYIRDLILRELKNFDIIDEDDEAFSSDSSIRASQMINRFISEGWIESKYDHMEMDNIFNFTRTGRKIAQTLHQVSSRHLATRHRNVRSTLKSLQSYLDNFETYDLIDAEESSDYIISDLMDQINELHDARKNMVKQAMKNVEEASEGFFNFIEKDFRSVFAISLTEDSATRYSNRIHSVIGEILSNNQLLAKRNELMLDKYPHLNRDSFPVEEHLQQISNRVQIASDSKIPELIDAIELYMRSSEMVLKQAGAILAKKSSSISKLALLVKSSDAENKSLLLENLSQSISVLNVKMLDPQKISVKSRKKRRVIRSILNKAPELSPEQLQERKIRSAIRKHIGYTSAEVEKYIDAIMKENDSVINAFMPTGNYKEFLMSLHSPAVALKVGSYKVTATGRRIKNDFTEIDEYLIEKKDTTDES